MVRDSLRYHGDQAARGARLDFAVNVRTPTPTWLRQELIDAIDELADYPDPAVAEQVRHLIASNHNRSPEEVLLLAGVAEGFSLLPRLGLPATVVAPQFTEPIAAFQAADMEVRCAILEPPFTLREPEALAAQCAGRMVIVGNPTNPTGVLHRAADLLALAQKAEVLVVDEAFMDVVGTEAGSASLADVSQLPLASQPAPPNIVVFRSYTKTWALAGLRCGYALAPPDLIERLARTRPHWPLGTVQLRAMAAIARREAELLPQLSTQVGAQRREMIAMLRAAGWQVWDSEAPFVLARPGDSGGGSLAGLRRGLAQRGIAVRRCDTFPGLDDSYWRLAVRSREQVAEIIAHVAELTVGESSLRW